MKAAPERIRPGSEEENLTISGWLDVLTKAKEAFEKEPTRGYIDLSDEPLPDLEEMDDEPDHGEEGVAQPEPVLRRVRGKRMPERALPEPMRDEQDDVIMPQAVPLGPAETEDRDQQGRRFFPRHARTTRNACRNHRRSEQGFRFWRPTTPSWRPSSRPGNARR